MTHGFLQKPQCVVSPFSGCCYHKDQKWYRPIRVLISLDLDAEALVKDLD